MKKHLLFVICLALFLNFSLGAMVTFYVIETGLPENGALNRYSELWENAFMDVFFDAGYIVSNAPILRLHSKPSGDILQAVAGNMSDIALFGIDYVLIAVIDFNSESQAPGEITLLIYKVSPKEKILERQINGRANRSSRDEFDDIKSIVRGLVSYIR
jgi:hypothetical protein